MIEYVKGELTEITPASAVVECGGVGYMLNISLNTYTRLQNERQAKVYVYEAIREDAHLLYGFADREERALFLLLITVSGVGREHGENDPFVVFHSRLARSHSLGQRESAQGGERNWCKNGSTYNC